jgi:hypothetical protein
VLLADLAVLGLAVDQGPAVERISEDRPDGALAPGGSALAPIGCGSRRATGVEILDDAADATLPLDVRLVDLLDNGGLKGVGHQADPLAVGLPSAGVGEVRGAVGLPNRPAVAVRGPPADPMPARRVGPEAPGDDLGELLAVVVGQDPLQRLDEVAGDAALVRARLVRVDHPDARPAERTPRPVRRVP